MGHNERGLPSVPQGLGRPLTVFLQQLLDVVARLCGAVRGSDGARALRVSEASQVSVGSPVSSVGTSALVDGAVSTGKLADKAVTGKKLADKAVSRDKLEDRGVTTEKLALEAVASAHLSTACVQTQHVAAQAISGEKLQDDVVTTDKLADGAVMGKKLGEGLLTIKGTAADGEDVTVSGAWLGEPAVCLTGFELTGSGGGQTRVGVDRVRLEDGAVRFMTVARTEQDGVVHTGTLHFVVIGRARWMNV